MIPFKAPDWIPNVEPGMRILITGASGGLGRALVNILLQGPDCRIGAHGASKQHPSDDPRIIHLTKAFNGADDCAALVGDFINQAGGIDALVVLSGGIHFSGHWKGMPEADWARDMDVNLNQPFFLRLHQQRLSRALARQNRRRYESPRRAGAIEAPRPCRRSRRADDVFTVRLGAIHHRPDDSADRRRLAVTA